MWKCNCTSNYTCRLLNAIRCLFSYLCAAKVCVLSICFWAAFPSTYSIGELLALSRSSCLATFSARYISAVSTSLWLAFHINVRCMKRSCRHCYLYQKYTKSFSSFFFSFLSSHSLPLLPSAVSPFCYLLPL